MTQRIGFDNEAYLSTQSSHIRERIAQFGDILYLEFGGKLFDDHHASRVLPGFQPDSKIRMLAQLKDEAEVIIAINADDIEQNKTRGDSGLTYDVDTLRLIDAFRTYGLYVSSVVLTRFTGQRGAIAYQQRLETLGLKVYRHYPIEGYPHNIAHIVSDEGYGANEFVETSRRLIVVTAPGPGSGKMATCLSQLYHENKRGVKAGYAKFETFPIWNLPLKHPVNLAYEAATADLGDVNMIDPFHLEAYGKTTVNYNRDIEIFPVLSAMMQRIQGNCPYQSPTDMGVNMAGNCIIDDEATREAANQEILRRYYNTLTQIRKGLATQAALQRIEMIMTQAGLTPADRAVVPAAREHAERTGGPTAALQLHDGTIILGRTSDLLGASSAMLLNALKHLAGIPDPVNMISPMILEPICELETKQLGHTNPRLHTEEVLVALSVCALTDINARNAINQLSALRGCDVHTSVILSQKDEIIFRRLGINLTCEAAYQTAKLYHA